LLIELYLTWKKLVTTSTKPTWIGDKKSDSTYDQRRKEQLILLLPSSSSGYYCNKAQRLGFRFVPIWMYGHYSACEQWASDWKVGQVGCSSIYSSLMQLWEGEHSTVDGSLKWDFNIGDYYLSVVDWVPRWWFFLGVSSRLGSLL
jgi:hypothetical protein